MNLYFHSFDSVKDLVSRDSQESFRSESKVLKMPKLRLSRGRSSESRMGNLFLHLTLSLYLLGAMMPAHGQTTAGGTWRALLENAGISSMHTMVTRFNTVVFLDRTDIGATQINLPDGRCRDDPNDQVLTHDCYAHSVVFDPNSNTVRPLEILTDTWCSSGSFFSNGTMVQTGGDFDGNKKIRLFAPCPATGSCDWVERNDTELQQGRWYSTNQLLPDNTMITVGGRNVFTYEFIPERPGTIELALLRDTQDPDNLNDNLYPYVHLLPDGNLFIFANRDSVLLNYKTNTIVRTYPTIPGEPRNYPSAGSSVMLPLDGPGNGYRWAEVLVCGGSRYGAFNNFSAQYPASNTCGRINASSTTPRWLMETMPIRRNMGDMILLPTGNVLLINGAQQGSQGWGGVYANPTLNPVGYVTNNAVGSRFVTYNPSTIPRVYHSTAVLIPDGRILVAGSNSHQFYTYTGTFPTEFRVESFSLPYLQAQYNSRKPGWIAWPGSIAYGQVFTITITLLTAPARGAHVEMNLISCPYTTHSYAMGQRLIKLVVGSPVATSTAQRYTVRVTAPPSAVIAPPSYYMAFLNNNGIPSRAVWIHVG